MKIYILLLFVVISLLTGCVDTSPQRYTLDRQEEYANVLKNEAFTETAKDRTGDWVVVDVFETSSEISSPRSYVMERKSPFSRFTLRSIAFAKFGPPELDGSSLKLGDVIRITPHSPTFEQYMATREEVPDFYTSWDENWGYLARFEFIQREK
jgi:hypothetical protein